MFKAFPALVALSMLLGLPTSQGQDYSVEVIDAGPDATEIAPQLAESMSDKGYRVKKGSRTVAEIWYRKEWKLDPAFEKSSERLYPFEPEQLIGVLHFPRRGSDFREQTISSGWYTLRFALLPVDGNHEGTSPTRDFLLLVEASQDAADKQWQVDDLNRASSEAAGSTHPATLCLQDAKETGELPSMRHDDFNDWWILRAAGKGITAEKQAKEFPIELVVAGHAFE